MADTDVLPSRGVPRMALVDSTGVATNGSSTIAQLAAKGIQSICAVDATGVSVGGPNVAQLASAGIRSFCPVDENGVAQDSSTAIQLQTRGIRPMVLLGNTGIALTGSSDMPTLARRGLSYFCPVDESGNATTMGPVVLLSNATVQDNVTVGTNVGVLSVAGGSGTYAFTLTSNPGSHFVLAGTNGVNLNTATAMTVGTYPITVQAAGGVPTPVTRTFAITVIPSPVAPANTALPVISGSTVVGQTLTTTSGTWTGFPAPTFTYQWQRDVPSSNDPATDAWVLAVTTAGGAVSPTQIARVNTLIVVLKAAGLFVKLDRLWLWGGESDVHQATIDIVNLATLTVVGSPALGAAGYTGGAGKALDSGFKPSTAGGKYTLSSASFGFFDVTTRAAATERSGTESGGNEIYLYPYAFGANTAYGINNATFNNGANAAATPRGCWTVTTNGTASVAYRNGTPIVVDGSDAATGLPTVNIAFLASTQTPGVYIDNTSDTFAAGWIGAGRSPSEENNFNAAIQAYITAWGI